MENGINKTGRIKGTEVFVGGLPQSVTEDMIREMFSKCGEIDEIRLMKGQRDKLKGYGFVRYTSREGASRARKEKNGITLHGKKIVVAASSDQDTLFVANLRKDWKQEEIEKMLRQAFQDVIAVDVALAPATDTSRRNRGFAFVHFSSHAAAARAFKSGNKSDFLLPGKCHPVVDWAETDMSTDPDEMSKVTVAFVGNLPVSVNEDYLRKLFEPFGKVERIAISRKGSLPVGFVHFRERSDLEAAIARLDDATVDGPDKGSKVHLQVSVANPVEKVRKREREEPKKADSRKDGAKRELTRAAERHSAYGDDRVTKASRHSVDHYKLVGLGLSPKVTERLLLLFQRGPVTQHEVYDSVLESLKDLSEQVALAVLDKFSQSNFKEIRNKGGYLATMIKKSKKDSREAGSHSLGSNKNSRSAVVRRAPHSPTVEAGLLGGIGGGTHYSTLDSYYFPSITTDANLLGLDAYGAISRMPNYANTLPSESMLSRLPTILADTQPYRSNSSLLSVGALGGPETSITERRPFKFDPFTGEAFKFDPFTGEPLQPLSLSSGRMGGKYF